MSSPNLDRMSLAPFARRAGLTAGVIFTADVLAYVAFVYLAVTSDALLAQFIYALLAGAVISLLAIVGHDAAHQSFFPNKTLNRVLGTIAFLPALHPFTLWEHHHNKVHHRFTAQIGVDNAFSPMTVEQYRAASPGRRSYYRFMRSLWGQPFFYLADIWWPNMAVPFAYAGGKELTRTNWFDLGVVYAYLIALVATCTWLSHTAAAGRETWCISFLDAVYFGALIPFLTWNAFIAFVTIVQHTGPDVRWSLPSGQPTSVEQAMAGTVHIRFPNLLDWAMHRVMQHQAHHVHMGVPLYRLKGAQAEVTEVTQGENQRWWTPAYHMRLTRECKLYDPEANTWVGFDAARRRRVQPARQDRAA